MKTWIIMSVVLSKFDFLEKQKRTLKGQTSCHIDWADRRACLFRKIQKYKATPIVLGKTAFTYHWHKAFKHLKFKLLNVLFERIFW